MTNWGELTTGDAENGEETSDTIPEGVSILEVTETERLRLTTTNLVSIPLNIHAIHPETYRESCGLPPETVTIENTTNTQQARTFPTPSQCSISPNHLDPRNDEAESAARRGATTHSGRRAGAQNLSWAAMVVISKGRMVNQPPTNIQPTAKPQCGPRKRSA